MSVDQHKIPSDEICILKSPTSVLTNGSDLSEIYICDIFSMNRSASEEEVVVRLPMIWTYKKNVEMCGIWFTALLFYLRNFRDGINTISKHGNNTLDTTTIPKGRGEKIISYYMVLWLLNKDESLFNAIYAKFVKDIGYYKDCLNLAKMAKARNYTDGQIRLLLMPMAMALMHDENIIIQSNIKKEKNIRLSLASKWAPRAGKSFTNLIPYLKQLCNITGRDSDMKWRKYIQHIIKYKFNQNNANYYSNNTILYMDSLNSPTIESLLSTKQYNRINLQTIPKKAFKLYENVLVNTPELTEKYFDYVYSNKCDNNTKNYSDELRKNQDIRYLTDPLETISQYIDMVYNIYSSDLSWAHTHI